MKLTSLVFVAATLSAGAAMAQSVMDPVIADLTAQGYTNVQVERIGDTYRVEAMINGKKRELIYDATTGKILSDRLDTDGDGVVDKSVISNDDEGGSHADDNGQDDSDASDNGADNDSSDDAKNGNSDDHGENDNGRNDNDNDSNDNDGESDD